VQKLKQSHNTLKEIIYGDTRFALPRDTHPSKGKIAKESFEEYVFSKLEIILLLAFFSYSL
jgi:hypothetical protein